MHINNTSTRHTACMTHTHKHVRLRKGKNPSTPMLLLTCSTVVEVVAAFLSFFLLFLDLAFLKQQSRHGHVYTIWNTSFKYPLTGWV